MPVIIFCIFVDLHHVHFHRTRWKTRLKTLSDIVLQLDGVTWAFMAVPSYGMYEVRVFSNVTHEAISGPLLSLFFVLVYSFHLFFFFFTVHMSIAVVLFHVYNVMQ